MNRSELPQGCALKVRNEVLYLDCIHYERRRRGVVAVVDRTVRLCVKEVSQHQSGLERPRKSSTHAFLRTGCVDARNSETPALCSRKDDLGLEEASYSVEMAIKPNNLREEVLALPNGAQRRSCSRATGQPRDRP